MLKKLKEGEVPRDPFDFIESLIEQVGFLVDACDKYDHGNFHYSKQLAMHIRALVHQTSNQTSLLTHLNKQDIMKFGSTASFPRNAVYFLGLVFPTDIRITNTDCPPRIEHVYLPSLNANKEVHNKWVDFDTWWNQKIIISDQLTFSRKEMITYMANKDFVHVDENIVEKYYKISKATSSMFYATDKPLSEDPNQLGEPFKYLHFAVVRQITHELILSIRKEFNIRPSYNPTNKYNLNGRNVNPQEFILVKGTQIEYER